MQPMGKCSVCSDGGSRRSWLVSPDGANAAGAAARGFTADERTTAACCILRLVPADTFLMDLLVSILLYAGACWMQFFTNPTRSSRRYSSCRYNTFDSNAMH
jgi:hypothetical protein